MTLARVGTFTTYMTATLLEKEFNNIACKFGRIVAGELNIASSSVLIDYYRGNPAYDLVTNIASAVTAKRPLYLPAGTYIINNSNTTCHIPDGMIIRGAGIDRTILLEKDGNTASELITIGGGARTGKNVYLYNLTMQHSADLDVNGHIHTVRYVYIVGTGDAYCVFNRVKFDLREYNGTSMVNGIYTEDTISALRCIHVQQCVFKATYYCGHVTGCAIFATESPLKLSVSDSIFIGWKIAISVGDTTPNALQLLSVIDCSFTLISTSPDASSHAIISNGGAIIKGNIFSSSAAIGTCTYFILATNNGTTTVQIIGNILSSSTTGPTTGIAICGDNFIVMDAFESVGSAGFTSGLLQLTGLSAGASNCWWDTITALDSTQNILPDACEKRGARSSQYIKGYLHTYDHAFKLSNCKVRLIQGAVPNDLTFSSIRPGQADVEAKIVLTGNVDITD